MENLKITFLGGIGEIGKNMTVFEYGDDMIVVDSGLSFPDESMPGIDLVVQDLTYLIENKSRIRGVFITHGHEDHIGSISYLLDHIKAPIYGSKISLGLIENKIKESKKSGVILKPCSGGTVVVAGNFKVEFVNVTHSIPGSMAFVITTPAGVVVHSGDFKIDFTPIGNDCCDLKRLADVGKKGVTLLLCESTNVEREGFSMSESIVGKTFNDLYSKIQDKRIIIATFASNIHRLQQIIDLAVKNNRKIAFTGRSMVNVSDMAIKLGELHCNKDLIIDIDKIDKYADKELIIISTGSQGESMSALTRMCDDNFPKIKLNENDAVILSSSPIPGNEKAINTIINKLYMKDCQVIYNELADVHASGHAYKEELKIFHSLIKPKFFIPIHGEYRHLKNHQMLARDLGMKERDIIIPSLGMQVEVNNNNVFKVVGAVQAGDVLIDGTGMGDKDSSVIRDRLTLSQDGVCAVVVHFGKNSRMVLSEPDIISRGFIYQEEASDIITEARSFIFNALKDQDLKSLEMQEIKNTIRKIATNYFFKKTKRKPMILSIVVEEEENLNLSLKKENSPKSNALSAKSTKTNQKEEKKKENTSENNKSQKQEKLNRPKANKLKKQNAVKPNTPSETSQKIGSNQKLNSKNKLKNNQNNTKQNNNQQKNNQQNKNSNQTKEENKDNNLKLNLKNKRFFKRHNIKKQPNQNKKVASNSDGLSF